MKKTLILFLLFISVYGMAQNHPINGINITLPTYPDANTANWGTGTSLFMITASSKGDKGRPSPQVEDSKILVIIKKDGSKFCGSYTSSNAPESGFNTTTKVWGGKQAVGFLGDACVLPPGDYELSVQFFGADAVGMSILSEEKTKAFTIKETEHIVYQAPQTISPANGTIFSENEIKLPITFRWIPVVPKPNFPVTYRLKIWQLLKGQTGTQAMQSNQPIFTKDVDNITQVVVSNMGDIDGAFDWALIALNREGKPIGENNGMSNFSQFSIKSKDITTDLKGLSVKLQQPPPYQLMATDLWNGTLTNTSKNTLHITLSGTLKSATDGKVLEAQSRLITLPSGTKRFTYDDVKSERIKPIFDRWGKYLASNKNAPDGNYTICVYIKNEKGEEIESDCIDQTIAEEKTKVFIINETEHIVYQPPQIITPVTDAELSEGDLKKPITFRWTPIVPTPNFPVTYRLKIWQLLKGQTGTQAMQSNQLIFTKDVDNITQVVDSNIFKTSDLENFIWNVQALNREGKPIGENKGTSNASQFSKNNPVNPNTKSLIVNDETTGEIFANDTIYAGYNSEFAIITTQVTNINGEFSGKGTAYINWLKARVSVKFNSITVDTDKKLTAGKILAEIYSTAPVYSQDWALGIVANNPWANNTASSVVTWVQNQSNQTIPYNNLNAYASPVKLPLGVNFPSGDQLAITEMVFRNNKSEFNMVTAKTTPQSWGNPVQLVGFVAKNIEFHPNNIVMPPNRIELVQDVTIVANPHISFTFKKPTSSNTGCYVEWGTNGFSQYGIELQTAFTRDWLIPSPDDGTSKSKATLTAIGTSWNDLILSGTLEKSELVPSQGMTILADTISYDMSDVLNPPNITFPQNYHLDTTNLFRGFYMKNLVVEMPESWQTQSGKPQLSIQNMIIDNTGITLFAEATNVVQFPNANVADLVASIDTVHIEIESSSLVQASIKGRIGLPISKVDSIQNPLKYIALFNNVQPASGINNFELTIEPTGPINAHLLKGIMNLDETSNIVAYIDKNKKTFNTTLNGNFLWNDITLGPVKHVKMDLGFEGLSLNYDSSLSSNNFVLNQGTWSFASPQKFLAGFPVTIDNIKFNQLSATPNQKLHGKLNFDVIFNLTNDIGGQSKLGVEAAINENPAGSGLGKFKPEFIGASIDDISVYANLAAVSIDGTIQFRNNDPVYGNGFIGTLQATFKTPKVSIEALAEFGNTNYQYSSTYRYWRVEAAALFKPGLPFLSGVAFYGFGGGASYNMLGALVPNATLGKDAYTFTPQKGTFGFKVQATIGTTPKVETFNADVGLNGQFSSSKGLINIGFTGDFYVGADLLPQSDRDKAQIKGNVVADYNFPDKHFYMHANVNVDADPIKTLSPSELTLDSNGKTNKWFFKFGEPTNINEVTIFNVKLYQYLMFGNDIQAPDNGFTEDFRSRYYDVVDDYPGIPSKPGVDGNSATGKGIALGVGISFDHTLNTNIYKNYNLELTMAAGAEVNLSMMEYVGQNCANTSQRIGLNGWRARGSIGFYVGADAKVVNGNDTWNLLTVKAAGWLDAKFPRPTYVAGAVYGDVQIGHSTARAHTFAPGQCSDKSCTHTKTYGSGFKHTSINGVTGPVCSNFYHQCTHLINNYLVDQSFNKTFDWGDGCGSTDTTLPDTSGPAITQQDAAEDQEQLLIKYVHPSTTYNFPKTMPIAVKYGLPLNDAFDVYEQQGNGSVLNRTFKLVTNVVFQQKNDNSGVYTTIFKKRSKNNLGEYLYTKVGPVQIQSQQNLSLSVKNNPNTILQQTVIQQIGHMPLSNVNNQNIAQGSLSNNTALQTLYPAPQTNEYDNLPPDPVAVENSLEVNKWYKIIVTATLKEYKNNVWVNALKIIDSSPVTQTVTKTFRTGPLVPVSTYSVK